MNEQQLFKEDYCKVWYNSDDQIIYAEWKGFLKLDEVKKGCALMTKYIKDNDVKAHLSNHVKLRVLTKDVQEYLTQSWFPEVEKAGLRKVAALVSDDVFAKATVDKVNKTAQVGRLTISTFNSEKDSISWLKEEMVGA